jgi:hypothetical protein
MDISSSYPYPIARRSYFVKRFFKNQFQLHHIIHSTGTTTTVLELFFNYSSAKRTLNPVLQHGAL